MEVILMKEGERSVFVNSWEVDTVAVTLTWLNGEQEGHGTESSGLLEGWGIMVGCKKWDFKESITLFNREAIHTFDFFAGRGEENGIGHGQEGGRQET